MILSYSFPSHHTSSKMGSWLPLVTVTINTTNNDKHLSLVTILPYPHGYFSCLSWKWDLWPITTSSRWHDFPTRLQPRPCQMRHPSPDVEQTMLEMVMISVAVELSSNGIMGNIQKWEVKAVMGRTWPKTLQYRSCKPYINIWLIYGWYMGRTWPKTLHEFTQIAIFLAMAVY